jgi:CRP-like cAMP-binding protein
MTSLIDDRARALRRSAILSTAAPEDLVVLAAMMREESFIAGETVCEFGEHADRAFFIASGELDVRLPRHEGIVRTMTAGEVVGEYGMFGEQARTSTIVARSDARLLSIDYERFRKFLLDFPEVTLALLQVTARRLIQLERGG